MTRRITRLILTGLLTAFAACVINTRPHLPGEDSDAGRFGAAYDAGVTAADAGGFVGVPGGDASAPDVALGDAAPPTNDPDASGGAENLLDCFAADGSQGDAGDAGRLGDAGDAGFIDRDGRACDPTRNRTDAGRDASADGEDGRTSR